MYPPKENKKRAESSASRTEKISVVPSNAQSTKLNSCGSLSSRGGGHQAAEQRLRQSIRARHALGMPLHTHHPVGISGPFDGFDYAIWRACGNPQAPPRLLHRLMVRAIHARFIRAG